MNNVYCQTNNINALCKDLSFLCNTEPVFLCIGTDLAFGDCFGPLVGQMLIEADIPFFVYGSIKNPITALGVETVFDYIRFKHPHSTVVAIDSSIGDTAECGKIKIKSGPIVPAAALSKRLMPVGDVSVTAVVSSFLPNTSQFLGMGLKQVYLLAFQAATMLKGFCQQFRFYNKTKDFAINAGINHIKF